MAKLLNLPTILISLFLIRLLATGAGIGDSIVMVVLGGLLAGQAYLEHIKQPVANKDLIEKISQIDERLTTVKQKVDSYSLGGILKK